MLTAVAVPLHTFPQSLIERVQLSDRIHDRGGERELQFHFGGMSACLPIRVDGQLRIVRWGCRRNESRVLPATGWTKAERIESGYWREAGAEMVEIPAALGLDHGFWFAIPQGIRALRVLDEHGVERVYVICEPSSHYYAVMTRSTWMPVMVGERV